VRRCNGSRAAGLLVAVAALAHGVPAAGAATDVAVVIVPPFDPATYADRGALGLLVPGAGATVSREAAVASLIRGKVENALLGGVPSGRPRIVLSTRPGPVTVYVSLPPPGRHRNTRRYPIAVVGPGFHGRLDSSTTRIPGLLSIADVAPFVLALRQGGDSPVTVHPDPDAPADLARLDRRLTQTHDARAWAQFALVMLMLIPAGLAALTRLAAVGRAALLAAPTALLVSLLLSAVGVTRPTVLDLALAGVSVVVIATAAALTDRWPFLATALVGVFVVYLLVLDLWPAVNALAVIGPHPDGGVRFYGMTNVVETLLLGAALAVAALVGVRWLPPVAALSFSTLVLSATGADAGGAIVFAAALLAFAIVAIGAALTPRRIAVVLVAAVALTLALIGIDAAAGGASHATHAVAGGPGALLGDIGRRIHLSALAATANWHAPLIVVGCLAILAWLATRRPVPTTVRALVVGVAVSLVVNDSPTDVASFGMLSAMTLLAWERTRPEQERS